MSDTLTLERHREAHAASVAEAQWLRGELDGDSSDLTAEQRLSREERCTELLDKAEGHKADIQRLEAEQHDGTGERLTKPGTGPVRSGFNAQPDTEREVWTDDAGNRVALVGKGDSFAAAVADTSPSPVAAYDVGEAIVAEVKGINYLASTDLTGNTLNPINPLTQLSPQVIDLARSESVLFNAGARTVNMTSTELSMVRVLTDPTIAWVGELKTIPESKPSFGRLRFRARKMGCIATISRELIEDAPNASSEVRRLLGIAVGRALDTAALSGTGKGEEPLGLFNYTGLNTSATVGAIDYDKFLDAAQKVEDAYGTADSIIDTPAVKTALAKLKETGGAYIAPPADYTAMSRFTSKQIADTQALVGDFGQVIVGVRTGAQIAVTTEADGAFKEDSVKIKITWRGDVQVAQPGFITRMTGITTS